MYDSQGIYYSSQVSKLPPINKPTLHIPTEFATENLCDGLSKENKLILPSNTYTPQLFDNLIIPSNSNTPQLGNI